MEEKLAVREKAKIAKPKAQIVNAKIEQESVVREKTGLLRQKETRVGEHRPGAPELIVRYGQRPKQAAPT
jgi:hypothetical protein